MEAILRMLVKRLIYQVRAFHTLYKVYFWDDQEMLDMICDLNNYADEMHSNFDVCANIIDRMKNGYGLLTEDNYQQKINHFFDFLDSYNYDKIFV